MMQNFIVIGMGGFLGAVARYAIGLWIGQKWGRTFPLGTFFINISGSFYRLSYGSLHRKTHAEPSVENVLCYRVPWRIHHLFHL